MSMRTKTFLLAITLALTSTSLAAQARRTGHDPAQILQRASAALEKGDLDAEAQKRLAQALKRVAASMQQDRAATQRREAERVRVRAEEQRQHAEELRQAVGRGGSVVEREGLPRVATEMISVSVEYPGASPAEVEERICMRIEEGVRGIEGVKRVTSTAGEGRGIVLVEPREDADISRVLDDVKARVDAIDGFPNHAEEPVIREIANVRIPHRVRVTLDEEGRARVGVERGDPRRERTGDALPRVVVPQPPAPPRADAPRVTDRAPAHDELTELRRALRKLNARVDALERELNAQPERREIREERVIRERADRRERATPEPERRRLRDA